MSHLGPSLRRSRRRDHPAWRVLAAVLLSLGLNWLALTRIDASFLGLGAAAPVREVSMAPLDAAAWQANRAVTAKPTVAPAPPDRPLDRMGGQVVDLGPAPKEPPKTRPPPQTRFLSDRDSVVEKETRSRYAGQKFDKVAPEVTAAAGGKPPGQQGRAPVEVAGPEGQKGVKTPTPDQGKRLALAPPPEKLSAPRAADGSGDLASGAGTEDEKARRREPPATPGTPGQLGLPDAGARGPGALDGRLALTPRSFASFSAGPSADHIRDVEEGEGTYLNAREFRYATFFNNMKQSLLRTWRPAEAYEKRDPELRSFPHRDWVTVLQVTLDEVGALRAVAVRKESGLDFLDRAAVDAFREAQPFPNPPQGMVENGLISFQFSFAFDTTRSSDGPRVRIQRWPN